MIKVVSEDFASSEEKYGSKLNILSSLVILSNMEKEAIKKYKEVVSQIKSSRFKKDVIDSSVLEIGKICEDKESHIARISKLVGQLDDVRTVSEVKDIKKYWYLNDSIDWNGTALYLFKDGSYKKCSLSHAEKMTDEEASSALNKLNSRLPRSAIMRDYLPEWN